MREEEIKHAAETASSYLRLGKDTLLMTSRELIKGKSELLVFFSLYIALCL